MIAEQLIDQYLGEAEDSEIIRRIEKSVKKAIRLSGLNLRKDTCGILPQVSRYGSPAAPSRYASECREAISKAGASRLPESLSTSMMTSLELAFTRTTLVESSS